MNFIITFSIKRGNDYCLVKTDEQFNILDGITSPAHQSGFCGCVVVDKTVYALTFDKLYVIQLNPLQIIDEKKVGSANHGMCYDKKHNQLLIVSSGEGLVYILDRSDLSIISTLQHTDSAKSPRDFHINSVDVKDNLIAVTVHNRKDEGYITCFDRNDLKHEFILTRGFKQPHHFKFVDNGFVVCSSLESKFMYCRTPIENSWEVTLKNYTRGVYITPFGFYVCSSTNRSRNRDGEVIQREVDNTVYKLDKSKGTILEQHTLNTKVGQEIFAIYGYLED